MALALSPLLMPPGYSWVSNTTSESAAQRVPGAWLARLGFMLFGLSVLVLVRRRTWSPAGSSFHAVFGALMIAAAVFSTRSWVPDMPFDRTEDTLHSAAATAMGFAFAGGVATVLFFDHRREPRRRPLTITALAAAVVVPLGMLAWPGADGVLQRAMFGVAYVWYGSEAVPMLRTPGTDG